jgi:dCTP deaminase
MLLSHNEIIALLDAGVIKGWKDTAVNAASLDIHLGDRIMREVNSDHGSNVIDYRARHHLRMATQTIDEDGYVLHPGEFILAQSAEIFNLPLDVSAEYKLKSSMARIGLDHMNAGWCDAGWHGSVLTLEFKNMSQFHSIRIRPGDAIGQIVFFRHAPVELDQSYSVRGRYNGDLTVSGIKK